MSHDVEVSRVMAATPERLYELVSDLTRMGEWSPENTGGKWVKGSTGPAVGARFKGSNRKGPMRWSTDVTVVVADPGREFAFDVKAAGMKVARWGYRFEAVEAGTEVTEYWDDHRNPVSKKVTGWLLRIADRSEHNADGMARTLAAIAGSV